MDPDNNEILSENVGGPVSDLSDFFRKLDSERIITLNVCSFFEQQKEPLPAILEATGRLEAGEVLRLIVPFEPIPLYGVLGGEGFLHWSEPPLDSEGDWIVFFYREEDFDFGNRIDERFFEEDEELAVIDLRKNGESDWQKQILEKVEALVYGRVLLVLSDSKLAEILEMVDERGFGIRSKESAAGGWETRIWRKS